VKDNVHVLNTCDYDQIYISAAFCNVSPLVASRGESIEALADRLKSLARLLALIQSPSSSASRN